MPLEPEPFETERWDNPEGYQAALKALEKSKPPPRETPLPDLLIYTERVKDDGTPEVVSTRLRELRAERERIAQMWKAEGKTKTYIPNTREARTMKTKARLQNRVEANHAEIVRKQVSLQTVQITVPPDVVPVAAVEL